MDRVDGTESFPLAIASVVTIGFFDGVHVGHQAVVRRTVRAARDRGLAAVAVTFDRHPRETLTPGREPRLLTTLDRKAALLADLGVDTLVVLPFTEEFSRRSPGDFLDGVVRDALRARHVVVGSNFRFGHGASGTIQTLRRRGVDSGFSAEEVALVDVGRRPVSSSSVRDSLEHGDLSWPTRALGRRFVVDGEVVAGAGRGRGLGYPTANLRTHHRQLLPRPGIYAGVADVDAGRHVAAISVGTNPTFGREPLHVEAFLLDYSGDDLRGRAIAVEFWSRLRDEVTFDAPESLAAAIADDVSRTRELIGDPSTAGRL
jgi:riboflavin kinase / FMN adenylyltransferase